MGTSDDGLSDRRRQARTFKRFNAIIAGSLVALIVLGILSALISLIVGPAHPHPADRARERAETRRVASLARINDATATSLTGVLHDLSGRTDRDPLLPEEAAAFGELTLRTALFDTRTWEQYPNVVERHAALMTGPLLECLAFRIKRQDAYDAVETDRLVVLLERISPPFREIRPADGEPHDLAAIRTLRTSYP